MEGTTSIKYLIYKEKEKFSKLKMNIYRSQALDHSEQHLSHENTKSASTAPRPVINTARTKAFRHSNIKTARHGSRNVFQTQNNINKSEKIIQESMHLQGKSLGTTVQSKHHLINVPQVHVTALIHKQIQSVSNGSQGLSGNSSAADLSQNRFVLKSNTSLFPNGNLICNRSSSLRKSHDFRKKSEMIEQQQLIRDLMKADEGEKSSQNIVSGDVTIKSMDVRSLIKARYVDSAPNERNDAVVKSAHGSGGSKVVHKINYPL